MANLKLVFDARYLSAKKGEAPLRVRVSHKGKGAYITLPISLKGNQWNPETQKVINHDRKKTVNDEVETLFLTHKTALKAVEGKYDIESVDVKKLRDLIIAELNSDKTKFDKNTVVAVFNDFISHKTGNTEKLYKNTLRKIEAFEGKNAQSLRFEEITKDWLLRFYDYMAKSAPSVNARAIDLRNLRAVFNYAIDNGITTHYPFRRFKIKHEVTRKRNFDVETLRAIFNLDNLEPWEVKYRDLFKLTFMLIGINFVDLCNLDTINDDRIIYCRAKTKKEYSIKLEPEIKELIEKYKGQTHLLNYLDTYKNYRHFYNNTCKGLTSVKDKLKEKEIVIEDLTTYWARHSWATIARKIGISKDTVSLALGHSKKTVTDTYIEEDNVEVDIANRLVLDYVLYDKKPLTLRDLVQV